jgi:peptide/nickel transport system ATP-binding protein
MIFIESWLNRRANELSGEELQRFSILRYLNSNTKFLIANEITTILDTITQVQIRNSLIRIVKQ